MRKCTQEQFLKDVASHKMAILHNDGLYRHLKFKGRLGWNQWFEIITWPGKLTLSGDMGTWTFARLEDMFIFFRGDRINAHYWEEKLEALDRHGKPRQFSAEVFRVQVIERLEGYELSPEIKGLVVEQLDGDVFCHEDEHEALSALFEFNEYGVQFDSGEAPDGKAYSFRFIWCLWAIVWGIQQFDAATDSVALAMAAAAGHVQVEE